MYFVCCFFFAYFFCLGQDVHHNCKKFHKFLLEEFGRLFRMYTDLGKKESSTNDKLVCALERSDELETEVQRLRDELSEYHLLEYDL